MVSDGSRSRPPTTTYLLFDVWKKIKDNIKHENKNGGDGETRTMCSIIPRAYPYATITESVPRVCFTLTARVVFTQTHALLSRTVAYYNAFTRTRTQYVYVRYGRARAVCVHTHTHTDTSRGRASVYTSVHSYYSFILCIITVVCSPARKTSRGGKSDFVSLFGRVFFSSFFRSFHLYDSRACLHIIVVVRLAGDAVRRAAPAALRTTDRQTCGRVCVTYT